MSSKLGAVELALHTIIEGTSITTCFYGSAPAGAGTDFPYAVTSIADGGGLTFDINSRNRMTWPAYLEVYAQRNDTLTVPLSVPPNDQLYTVMEELIIAFDSSANRATLSALPNEIDVRVVDARISKDGTEGLITLEIEMDYPYVP